MNQIGFSIIRILVIVLIGFFSSCSNEDLTDEPMVSEVVPVNLTWSINLIGSDRNKLYGDGSGVMVCKASAKNAVRYGFKFGNGAVQESTTGELQHTFTVATGPVTSLAV